MGRAKQKRYQEQLEMNHQSFGVPLESDLSESVMNAFLLVYALNDAIALSIESQNQADLAFYQTLKEDEDRRDHLRPATSKAITPGSSLTEPLRRMESPMLGRLAMDYRRTRN
jgi:hypothetical protein